MAFNNYADVQAALDREHQAWLRGETVGRTQEGQAARDWWHSQQRPAGPPPAPPPAPPPPPPPGQIQTHEVVKIPESNVIPTSTFIPIPAEQLEKMYFQDIGGTEILAVARHDTVGGEEVVYTPVDNLKNVKLQFNPLNLMMSTRLDTLFNQFAIDINRKVTNLNVRSTPDEGAIDGVDFSFGFSENNDFVISVENINRDEYIQIEIAENVNEFPVGNGRMWYNWKEEK